MKNSKSLFVPLRLIFKSPEKSSREKFSNNEISACEAKRELLGSVRRQLDEAQGKVLDYKEKKTSQVELRPLGLSVWFKVEKKGLADLLLSAGKESEGVGPKAAISSQGAFEVYVYDDKCQTYDRHEAVPSPAVKGMFIVRFEHGAGGATKQRIVVKSTTDKQIFEVRTEMALAQ